MSDPSNRYASCPLLPFQRRDGRQISYWAPRMVPIGATLATARTIQREPSDRIDRLASRALSDPRQFWRLCDANDALDPLAFGRGRGRIKVPLPRPGE